MKEELHFNFQQFEIESEFDGKPHAFTRAFWCGEERNFALALVDGWIRFCEVDKLESGQWNFAVHDRLSKYSDHIKVDPIFIRNIFKTALIDQNIGRLLCFNELEGEKAGQTNEKCWFFVDRENQGFIQSGWEQTPFKLHTSLSITENSITQWSSEIRKSLYESQSDLAFSFQWHTNQRKHLWKLLSLENGTQSEMEAVALLLLRVTILFSETDGIEDFENLLVKFKLGTAKEPAELLWFCKNYWEDFEIEKSSGLYLLWEIFLRYFEPCIDLQLFKKYSALHSIRQYSIMFEASTCSTTAHEQLETHLQLRNWLQGKLPNEQIESILKI
jgi:hypothetical protein